MDEPTKTALEILADRVQQLELAQQRQQRPARGWRLPGMGRPGLALVACAFSILAVGAAVTHAQGALLPCIANPSLRCFSAGQPATAAEINHNFAQLATWLSAKTGTLGSSDITAQNVFFGSTTRQMLNLWNTAYGIGIQNSTQYFRTDHEFSWYRGGSHNNAQRNAGGGATLMRLESNGTLRASRLGQSHCAWRSAQIARGQPYTFDEPRVDATYGHDHVYHTAICQDGEYMTGFSCYATTYLDGNCAARCCRPGL